MTVHPEAGSSVTPVPPPILPEAQAHSSSYNGPTSVVQLFGPENLDAWHTSLLASLGDLQELVTQRSHGPSREPSKGASDRLAWKRNRRAAKKIIKRSIRPVAHLLPDDDDDDDDDDYNEVDTSGVKKTDRSGKKRKTRKGKLHHPHGIYKATLKAMRVQADAKFLTAGLVHDLSSINCADFRSLAAYQNRLQHLRRQLILLGCCPDDRFVVNLALAGLGESRRRLAKKLLKELSRDNGGRGIVDFEGLWENFMEHFSVLAIKEPITPIKERAERLNAGRKAGAAAPATP